MFGIARPEVHRQVTLPCFAVLESRKTGWQTSRPQGPGKALSRKDRPLVFKLIACDVLTRETSYCIARCPHTVNPVFLPKGEHNEPDKLRARLQSIIDGIASEEQNYDAVVLGYGLCGNATMGLQARELPLVVPRAHDCTTLFLGSKQAFSEHFGQCPSQTWASVGYSERGDTVIADERTRDYLTGGMDYRALVEQYGEENAKYVADMLRGSHKSDAVFLIDVPETRVETVLSQIRAEAAANNLPLNEIPGSLRLIEMLLSGEWPEADFLVVPPGHRIKGIYDMDQVIAAEAGET